MFYFFLSISLLTLLIIVIPGYGLFRIVFSKKKRNLIETLVISFVFGTFILCLDYIALLAFFGQLTQWNVLGSLLFFLAFEYFLVLFINKKKFIFDEETMEKFRRYARVSINLRNIFLCFIFAVALYFRLLYICSCYPLFTGFDTVLYVEDVTLHTREFPNYQESGIPFSHSLFYMLGAIFFSLFQIHHSVPVFVSVVDSFSIYGIYMLYRYISKSDRIAILGAFMYSLSFYAFRFFSDLLKEALVNSFLPIGLYLMFRGYDKKDIRDAIVAGLIFGFSILTHTDSLYRIALYSLFFIAITYTFSLEKKNQWLLRFACMIFLTTLVILGFYQVYLHISEANYSLLDRFFAAFSGPLKPIVDEKVGCEFTYAIPHSTLFLNDFLTLFFGNIVLIVKDKRNGIWWSLSSCTLLLLSQLPYMDIYISASVRIFYYYGFFSYLSKAAFLFFLSDVLVRRLTKLKKVILRIKVGSQEIAFKFSTRKFIYIIVITVLLFDCFVAQIDIFSFYPVKRLISNFEVFHQSAIGEVIITRNQYEKMIWLKSQITEKDYVITTGGLHIYASYILSIDKSKEIRYDLQWLENQADWLAAYNLLSGDLFNGVKYFQSKNVSHVYIELDVRTQSWRKLADELRVRRASVVKTIVYNEDIAVFRVDVEKVVADLEKIILNTYVYVNADGRTRKEHLQYDYFEEFPYFSLSLKGATKYNVSNIPKFLIFKSIFPQPENLTGDISNFIYFDGMPDKNYTLRFMAIYPYLNVGWKDDSFIEWTREEGVTFQTIGGIASIKVERIYAGILLMINLNISQYEYLILRHKVDQGWMEVYFIRPDFSSISVLVSGSRDWSTSIVDLHNLGIKDNIIAIKIQGDQVPTNFSLDFILFASAPP